MRRENFEWEKRKFRKSGVDGKMRESKKYIIERKGRKMRESV